MEKQNVVVIDAKRDAYGADKFFGAPPDFRTMTVHDLLILLEDMDPDARVIISNDRGYTYGSVWFDNISEAVVDPDTGEVLLEFE